MMIGSINTEITEVFSDVLAQTLSSQNPLKIKFDRPYTYYPGYSIATASGFTPDNKIYFNPDNKQAIPGSVTEIEVISDGTNIPIFSSLIEVSGVYDNALSAINIIRFECTGSKSKPKFKAKIGNLQSTPAPPNPTISRTIQSINSTGSIATWNSIVEIGKVPLTANISITLPVCLGNTGKDVIIKRLDNTLFTVTVLAGGSDLTEITTPSVVNNQFGSITISCVSNAKSEQTSGINISVLSGYVQLGSVLCSGATTDITDTIAIALDSYADDGSALLNQVSTGGAGVIVSGNNNRCPVLSVSGKTIYAFGEEVYSRLTRASNRFILFYYYLLNGVETAYNPGLSSQILRVSIPYRFQSQNFPKDVFISDLKLDSQPLIGSSFKFLIDTSKPGSPSNTFVLPLNSNYSYNFNINWGDGCFESVISNSNISHTYLTSGVYAVEIWGSFPAIYFNNTGDRLKLVEIQQWGSSMEWLSFASAFRGCSNLIITAIDAKQAKTRLVEDASSLFEDCSKLTVFPFFDFQNLIMANRICFNCIALTLIPKLNFSQVTDLQNGFRGCVLLVLFPQLNLSSATTVQGAWQDSGITNFPLIDLPSCIIAQNAWTNTRISNFPMINMSKCVNVQEAWNICGLLTTFPGLDLSSVTNAQGAWVSSVKLAFIGPVNLSSVTNFISSLLNIPPFSTLQFVGLKSSLSLANHSKNASDLNNIYRNLGQALPGATITVTGNPGATMSQTSIATNKGWTVTQ